MTVYKNIVGMKADFLPLRRFDSLYFSSKFYRDMVQGSNLVRKATQMVSQIEAAQNTPKDPLKALLNYRGGKLDTTT